MPRMSSPSRMVAGFVALKLYMLHFPQAGYSHDGYLGPSMLSHAPSDVPLWSRTLGIKRCARLNSLALISVIFQVYGRYYSPK